MSEIEDKMKDYKSKLDAIKREQESVHKQDLAKILEMFSDSVIDKKQQQALLLLNNRIEARQTSAVRELMEITGDAELRALDEAFYETFRLDQYFPDKSLRYRTNYCETLEEFYKPYFADEKISRSHKEVLLRNKIREAEALANEGGAYGVNFPGMGCYINGWLFAHGTGLSPKEARRDPAIARAIKKTVVHEKLGHGFLDVYSALGKAESSLGATAIKVAGQFGMHVADDPLTAVRSKQYHTLSNSSWFLQEGWATWLESFYDANIIGSGRNPKHSVDSLIRAIADIPASTKEDVVFKQQLGTCVVMILTAEEINPFAFLQAINFLHEVDSKNDKYFSSRLGQPLRYALGELIMAKIALNLGTQCVPYAALISSNISIDPEKISLSDLAYLLQSDPMLNPDTRLVMLSCLRIEEKDSVKLLVDLAENAISLQVPLELKLR